MTPKVPLTARSVTIIVGIVVVGAVVMFVFNADAVVDIFELLFNDGEES